MSDQTFSGKRFAPLAPLLWAVFLGVSWTWVIGMFLPVLLVRDYGAWAWVVFAAPNVLGAAAMGWVLRDAAASEQFVRRHAAACVGFSVVTIAFHVFFATWMIERVGGRGAGLLALGVALVAVAVGLVNRALRPYVVPWLTSVVRRGTSRVAPAGGRRGFEIVVGQPRSGPPVLAEAVTRPALLTGPGSARAAVAGRFLRWAGAALVLVVSVVMWNMLYGQGGLAVPSAAPLKGGSSGLALAYVAPVFLIGFALNPYLDLTFHRARQSTSPAGGRVAFGVGFGAVFFSMIVFTFFYARFFWPAVAGRPLSRVMSIYLVVHLVAQSAFTIAAHVGELPMRGAAIRSPRRSALAAAAVLPFLAAAAAVGWYASTPRLVRGHDLGEVVYWCFLGLYGLVFPGYVWLCAVPGTAGSRPGPTRRGLAVLAGVVAIAFPMYWIGFVEGRQVWLVPGLLVLLLSRALAPRGAARESVDGGQALNAGETSASHDPA